MRGKWLGRIMLATVFITVMGTVAWGAAPQGLPVSKMVFPDASVDVQIDVNGAVAMHLVGGAIDTSVAQLKQELATARKQPAEQRDSATLAALEVSVSAAESTRDALTSLQHVKFIAMKPKQPVSNEAFMKHYQGMLEPAKWNTLFSLVSKESGAILIMLSPEEKQLLFTLNGGGEMIAGELVTDKPLGKVLGELMKSAAPYMGKIVEFASQKIAKPTPPQQPAQPESPAQSEPPVEPEPEPEQ